MYIETEMYWSEVENDSTAKKVVGLILREINLKSLSKEDYVNGRVLLVEVELRRNETWTLIIA